MKSKLIIYIILSFQLLPLCAIAQKNNSIVFLFDNSGSLSGYYREQNSAFKLFSAALMKNAVLENDNAAVFLFTKTDPKRGIVSPKLIFNGQGKALIPSQVTANFTLMRGNDGGFGTTDLIEALDKGIETIESSANSNSGNSGIIWLVTDNINDNSGTGDSSYYNTMEFYKRLRSDDNIRKILLFPIYEKVTEVGFISNGYVVYGIVYSKTLLSQESLADYDKILRGVGIKQRAITLKPLDIGTIVLIPKVSQSKVAPGKLFYDGKKLRGFDFEEGEKIKETFSDLTLKSNLYPYIIRSARLDVKLNNFSSSDYSVKSIGTQTITPSTVSNVSPEGEVKGFTVIIDMPEITPVFSFNTIFKEDFTFGGNLILEVSSVDILLDENYINSFREIFALQSVPEIFKPIIKDKKIITTIPLEISMKYGAWRLFVLIGIISVILILLSGILFVLMRKKYFSLLIDNRNESAYCLNSFSSADVYDYNSRKLGKLKKSLSGKIIFTFSKYAASPGRKAELTEGIPVTIELSEDGFSKTEVTVLLKKTGEIHGNNPDRVETNYY